MTRFRISGAADRASDWPSPRIAFYIPTLAGGGAERTIVRLAGEFAARGYRVDLVVNRIKGPYASAIPAAVRVIELTRAPVLARYDMLRAFPRDAPVLSRSIFFARKPLMTLAKLPSLARYLAQERPTSMVSALWYANLLAVWARSLARVDTRVIVTARNTLSQVLRNDYKRDPRAHSRQQLVELIRRVYSRADAIVAVSNSVADDLAETTGLDRKTIQTIYNPVVWPGLIERSIEPVGTDWFDPGAPPVILAAGRFDVQKDYPTLLEAFVRVRRQRRARLIILGTGPEHASLAAMAKDRGVGTDVAMPGWVDNPYAYMRRAAVFVLASLWEGLPGVVIEALACGCPVVATDCPGGTREILAAGRYGQLVAPRSTPALAQAITRALDAPRNSSVLMARAQEFSIAKGVSAFQKLINCPGPTPAGSP